MKKKLLSLAIAGASVVAAQMSYAAGPTVYGKLNVSLQQVDLEVPDFVNDEAATDVDNWQLMSNNSRLGVAGDMEINSSLKAIYKLEYEVYVDDGDDGDDDEFKQRNIYVGLQGKDWGTLIAGKHDTPVKLAAGKADQFNDYYLGDIRYLMVGENRESNTIMYTTPNMSGFSLTAAIMPGEETDEAGASNEGDNDGIADHVSAALEYKLDALRLAAAIDSDVQNNDIIRLVAEYSMDQFEFGFIYQTAEANETDTTETLADLRGADWYEIKSMIGDTEQDAWVLSGAFKANDKLKLKAQIGMAETDFAVPNVTGDETLEVEQITVGADYALSSATTLYGYYSNLAWDYTEADVDGDGTTFGVGIDHKF